jgi:photosystem II stability/assembly factor-like uncharacterized protein
MATLLYAGTGQGVVALKSEAGGAWTQLAHGLKEWAAIALADPARPNRIVAGTRGDGVWLSDDFGKTWRKPSYGRRGPGKVRALAIDPAQPERIYAGCEPIDLFVSEDGGANWRCLDALRNLPSIGTTDYPLDTVEPHVRDIAIDRKNPEILYAALQVGAIAKSTDRGRSWRLLDKGLDRDVHTIVIDPADSNLVYAATGGHDAAHGDAPGRALYRSRDGGESWTPIAADFRNEYSVSLPMHPQQRERLFTAVANGAPPDWGRPTGAESILIRTRNGGDTWERVPGQMPDGGKGFPEQIVHDPSQPDIMYAAMRGGELCLSRDGGESWTKLEPKLPRVNSLACLTV